MRKVFKEAAAAHTPLEMASCTQPPEGTCINRRGQGKGGRAGGETGGEVEGVVVMNF